MIKPSTIAKPDMPSQIEIPETCVEESSPLLWGDEYVFPVSSSQEGLWFIEQMNPGNSAFNLPIPFRVQGPLQPELVRRTFDEIVRRHEILRTTFAESEGRVEQVIHAEGRAALRLVNLESLPKELRERKAQDRIAAEVQRPFDLAHGPLCTVLVLRLTDNDWFLLIHLHHMVGDGWSFRILIDEFTQLYNAFGRNEPSPLPELSLQFSDFAHWQREWHQTDGFQRELDHWVSRLQGAPAAIALPTDSPHMPNRAFSGATELVFLPRDLVENVREFCVQERVTLFMMTFAVFNALLYRYTGQNDIVIGTPIANRTQPELEPLIGFFVNNLVLRTTFDPEQSFRGLLQCVQESVIEAFDHQDVAIENIVKAINPDRSSVRNPIYQLLFSCQKAFIDTPQIPDLSFKHEFLDRQGTALEMWFSLIERDGGMRITIEYSTDLFRRETVLRMAEHYGRMLDAVVKQPDNSVSSLPMVTDAERTQILVDWNRTERKYEREVCVHKLFEEQVRRNPGATAVVFGDESLTYAQLDERADRLAAVLRSLGVGPNVLVGLCVNRSFDMVVSILGILKAGGAYVPIDPMYPVERIAFVLEDSKAPVLITQRLLLDSLPPTSAHCVLVDEPLDQVTTFTQEPDKQVQPSHLAYVIYTSGSTGKPKGVQIEHRALVNFLESMRGEPGLSADDVLLAVTTLSFDIAGLELHLPLITGARIVLAPWEVAADGEALLREVDRHGVTMLQATPATWELMLAAGWEGTPRLKALCGGEALPADLASELIPRCAELWNMYGPTETTIWSTCARITSARDIHVGRPIANTEIYILDVHQQPLPVGLAGELLIGGDGLARGYHNRPELTAEKFIPHPFKPDQRLYRTGDLAQYRSDGNIDCLGRLDFQVKIRGFRIELGEIEAQLSTHPAVHQNVIVAREDAPGEKRLVAYVVSSGQPLPSGAEMREHLRAHLPDYMLPAAFVSIDALPLTPNGKIDRQALPAPDAGLVVTPTKSAVAPGNPTEKGLAAIFSEVLSTPVTSVNDSFFDLGGHSLLAAKLMSRIECEFGVRLPLARLFDASTVKQIAEILSAEPDIEVHWNSLVPIRPRENAPTLFLVHGAGGNVLLYRELADQLAPEISVCGFQSQGLGGKDPVLKTVREMADHYVFELLQFQETGPYFLGGYCMGGIVAYEMARMLQAVGKEVECIFMLDSYNLSAVHRANDLPTQWGYVKQKMLFHVENLRELKAGQFRGYVREKFRMSVEAIQQAASKHLKPMRGKAVAASGPDFSGATIQAINHKAGWRHRPGLYNNGKVVLFKPKKNYDFFPDPRMGWGDCVNGGLEVVELSANPHGMLINPFVKQLATEIKLRIRVRAPSQ